MKRYAVILFIILLFSSSLYAGDDESADEGSPSPKRINVMTILPWAVCGTIVISLALYALHLAKSMGKRYSIKKEEP